LGSWSIWTTHGWARTGLRDGLEELVYVFVFLLGELLEIRFLNMGAYAPATGKEYF
jgi:hypothetical protein